MFILVARLRCSFKGNKDLLVPVDATCALYTKLVESGVPAINVVFPWTDHGFDLLFPQINPASSVGTVRCGSISGTIVKQKG